MATDPKNKCTEIIWKGRASCITCEIRKQVLFSDLPDEALRPIVTPIDTYCYPEKTPLYPAEAEGQLIYTVRKGLLKLYQILPNGKQRIVRLLKPGDVAGLELIVSSHYHHFAMTMHDSEICQIPVKVLTRLQADYPILYRQLLARWQSSLDEADRFITLFSTGSAHARMARLLLQMGIRENASWGARITREEMGDILGTSTETASRIIADFKRQQLLYEKNNTIHILDKNQLQQIEQDEKKSLRGTPFPR